MSLNGTHRIVPTARPSAASTLAPAGAAFPATPRAVAEGSGSRPMSPGPRAATMPLGVDGRGDQDLDVFAAEPPAPDDPLAHHPRVLALPHVAGVAEDMFRRAGPQLAAELERWRSGRPPLHTVNRPPSPRGLHSNARAARLVSIPASASPARGRSAYPIDVEEHR